MKWSRRPPPLSIRPDYSRSAASLYLGASPNPYHRSRTPSSSHSSASRHGRFEWHPRMPSDRGDRSPSLSSIVGMYRPPSSARNYRSHSQRACQFYYDYSEDFDNPTVREDDIQQQSIAHAELYHGDGGSEGECSPDADVMTNMDCAVQAKNCSPRAHEDDNNNNNACSPLMNSAESIPHNGEHNACNQADSRLGEVRALRKLSRSAPPSSQQLKQASLREDREAQNELAGLVSNSPRSKLLRMSKNLAGRPVSNQLCDKTNTSPNGGVADCSPDQSLPDFASIFGSFDLLDRSPYFKSTTSLAKALDASGDTRSIHSADHASHTRHIHDVSSTDTNSSEELVDESRFSLSRSAQGKKLDILSPEPISPVRGLKVKNSIPQLMKALPPLPSKLSQYVQNVTENSGPKDAEQTEQIVAEGYCGEDMMQNEPRKAQTGVEARASPSKFKVRVKQTTASQGHTAPTGTSYGLDHQAQSGELSQNLAVQALAKPKLKIRISRTQLGQGHHTTPGELPRANRLKDCNSLAELAPYSSKPSKIADNDIDVGGDMDKQGSHSDERHELFDGVDELPGHRISTSSQPSDPFNIPYPSTSDDSATNNRSISSSNKETLVPRPSCSPDTSLHHEIGLRKKMSMFRLRLVESLSSAKKDEKSGELAHSESHISIVMASKDSETNMTVHANHTSRSNKGKPDWMANRVKRWAMDAKRAVRSYVRRTLDRPPRRNV
ncbi:hypothetical protein E4U43_007553 [Claviceps pusilla]|uniref:Uncharacterized protein n=1 Tax=Claviceps pusilla TaxID=123648 RepID=A0A9P7NEQ1_9HYPO|nr:hypothetical protein E4U43_007553 [Claviceps pusilla]